MSAKTFFSYSRANGEFVLRLAKDLRAAGVDCWLDQLDIPAGERWDAEIEKALDSAERLVVVLTPDSVASTNVMDEVSFALEGEKRVVPILVQECDIPMRLRRVQHLDFTGDYQACLTRLLKQLEVGSEEPATPVPSAAPSPRPAESTPAVAASVPGSAGRRSPWKVVVPLLLVTAAAVFGLLQVFDGEPTGSSGTVGVAGYEFEYAADAPTATHTRTIVKSQVWSSVTIDNQSARAITAKWIEGDDGSEKPLEIEPGEDAQATPLTGNTLTILDTETSEEIVSFLIVAARHNVKISE